MRPVSGGSLRLLRQRLQQTPRHSKRHLVERPALVHRSQHREHSRRLLAAEETLDVRPLTFLLLRDEGGLAVALLALVRLRRMLFLALGQGELMGAVGLSSSPAHPVLSVVRQVTTEEDAPRAAAAFGKASGGLFGTDQITVYFLYTFSETRRATPPRHRTLGVGQTSDVRARLGAPGHASAGEGG